MEGILDELRSDKMVDGIAIDNLPAAESDSDDEKKAYNSLPGGGRSGMNSGTRTTRPELLTAAIRFSPTGREWGAATTQGLQIFSLDDAMLFAPTDLDIAITPQTVAAAINREEYSLAINMALHLGEREMLKKAIDAVNISAIELVIKSLDPTMIKDILKFLSEELVSVPYMQRFLFYFNLIFLYANRCRLSI